MTLDPVQAFEWLLKGGITASLCGFIYLLYKRKLRWEGELLEAKAADKVVQEILTARIVELSAERNKLFDLVISSQRMAAKSVDLASEMKPKASE